MFALTVIGVFVFIIAIIIYLEYKNEKAYQEERKKRTQERNKTKPPYSPKEKIQKPLQQKKEKTDKLREATPGAKKQPSVTKKEEKKVSGDSYDLKPFKVKKTSRDKVVPSKVTAPVIEKKKEKSYDLPKCKYPKFSYERLTKMGLSEEEAIEFTKELIPQIKTQIPLIKEAMEKEDFHNMERLTHSIKGSSTTVGTGGVSDLLVEYNTYLKTGKDLPIAEAYLKHLNKYAEDLEKEFA